ncbi:hypothetical protein CPC16_004328 [Podila verticillata]|nr:hypothetical protein BGZ59_004562 [Podila verticillata]KAF9369694.1 hypothetical protein CPC16_004328 [Podila verticillata]KAI9239566.1 MAG: hypothetical protein BYD32DRAFT_459675 [Podila humilis]
MKSFYAVALLAVIAVSTALPAPEVDTTEVDTTSPTAAASDNRWGDCTRFAIEVENECLHSSESKDCQDHFNTAKALCDSLYPTSTS